MFYDRTQWRVAALSCSDVKISREANGGVMSDETEKWQVEDVVVDFMEWGTGKPITGSGETL